MAKTNAAAVIVAPTAVAPGSGSTKASPAYSTGAFDISPNYGTGVNISILNGASGPGAPMQAQLQVSGDGTTWFDYGPPVSGDTANAPSIPYTWSIDVPKAYVKGRVIAWGHTTNSVTMGVVTQACTGL